MLYSYLIRFHASVSDPQENLKHFHFDKFIKGFVKKAFFRNGLIDVNKNYRVHFYLKKNENFDPLMAMASVVNSIEHLSAIGKSPLIQLCGFIDVGDLFFTL